jgi:2,4-dienoyl-CoA reductase-like NADH-dependent reductase (Old Yellow Enzyme family)
MDGVIMKHEKFKYSSLDEVKQKIRDLQVELPLSENVDLLKELIVVDGHKIPNRLAIQPMEGCDGTLDGSPDELTKRRYDRFAKSGAGLIWAEAVSIAQEGRANPRQLMLTEENLDQYKKLVSDIKTTCERENGFTPVVIMQATHSGRYSKPYGKAQPIIAYNNPIFEKDKPLSADHIVTDDRLKELEELYAKSAVLAEKAGFDGVDIKACHRYLLSELLSAFNRPGEYGGSFENRTRLYRNAIAAAKAAVSSNTIITSRLNIYDGFAYPNGWGVNENSGVKPDMTEPIKLVDILHNQLGVNLLDFTIGNPYFNPHVNRPYDIGAYEAPEHPLEGVARMCECISKIKREFKNLAVVSSGNSYLRHFSINQAAGMLEAGGADIIGFGRQAFAYPDFAKDIVSKGTLDSKKCCIACSKCTNLMRAGSVAGCVIRDTEVYLPLYKKHVLENEADILSMVSNV